MSDDREFFRDGLRSPHGTAAEYGVGPRVEVPPADELQPGVPAPVPGPRAQARAGRENGRWSAEEAKAQASRGGIARAAQLRRLREAAGVLRLAPGVRWPETFAEKADALFKLSEYAAPWVERADEMYAAKVAEVARDVGGGQAGVGVCQVIRTWAWQASMSALLFEIAAGYSFIRAERDRKTGLALVRINAELLAHASKLGDAARQSLLAAHHLARLESLARRDAPAGDDDVPVGFVRVEEKR